MAKATILFMRNGEFSYTNRAVLQQIRKNFPECDIIDHDVSNDTIKNVRFFIINTIQSIFTYGARAVLLSGRRYFYFIRTSYFFRYAARQYIDKLKREGAQIDAVIQTQGLFNALIPGVPLIVYTDYTYKSPSFGGKAVDATVIDLETDLFRNASAVLVTAGHVRDILVDDYRCNPDRVLTVYIGSNSVRTSADAPPDRFVSQTICFVGIDWERKGGEDLLAAFKLLAQRLPEAQLIIAGAAPQVDHPRIRVLGKIPREEVAELYRTSAIFCLPSHVEPSSVAAIEAATNGLPIVATRVGGFFDSVLDGESGLLAPPRDPVALAEALYTLLSNPELAQKMGEAGRINALTRFNWDRVGERIAGVVRTHMSKV